MNYNKVTAALQRLNLILDSVRLQNSGADIHTIGNIRNTAMLLRDQLHHDYECMDDRLVEQILKNTEVKVAEFYRKKYFNLSPCEQDHKE